MTNLPLTPFRSPSLLFSNPSGFMVGMMWILKNKKMLKSDCFSNGLKVIDMLWGLNVTCVMTTKITSSSQRVSWSCRSSCTTPEGIGSAAKASHVPRPRFRACWPRTSRSACPPCARRGTWKSRRNNHSKIVFRLFGPKRRLHHSFSVTGLLPTCLGFLS